MGAFEQLRRERGLRQRDVAKLAGVAPSYISMVEQGWRPPLRRQGAIAAALGVAAHDLWPLEQEVVADEATDDAVRRPDRPDEEHLPDSEEPRS